jgi:hypothetical protein
MEHENVKRQVHYPHAFRKAVLKLIPDQSYVLKTQGNSEQSH